MNRRRLRTPPTPECAQHPGFDARRCALCEAERLGEDLAQLRPEDLAELADPPRQE